jgi:hypothetical protein
VALKRAVVSFARLMGELYSRPQQAVGTTIVLCFLVLALFGRGIAPYGENDIIGVTSDGIKCVMQKAGKTRQEKAYASIRTVCAQRIEVAGRPLADAASHVAGAQRLHGRLHRQRADF